MDKINHENVHYTSMWITASFILTTMSVLCITYLNILSRHFNSFIHFIFLSKYLIIQLIQFHSIFFMSDLFTTHINFFTCLKTHGANKTLYIHYIVTVSYIMV